MHICCANCALYPIATVRQKKVDISGLWFNPNIYPAVEYKNRLNAVKKLEELWNINVKYTDCYGLNDYFNNDLIQISSNEGNRCKYCYMIRLEKTALVAKDMNFDAFTTTLLVSPYQKFDTIVEIGRIMQNQYSVEFYIEDFRKGFNEGKKMSRELNLYRQKYCGCRYSEIERNKRTVDRNTMS